MQTLQKPKKIENSELAWRQEWGEDWDSIADIILYTNTLLTYKKLVEGMWAISDAIKGRPSWRELVLMTRHSHSSTQTQTFGHNPKQRHTTNDKQHNVKHDTHIDVRYVQGTHHV